MWIILNDAFFSIVEDTNSRRNLLVRARRHGDIEKVFGVDATAGAGTDYPYRAFLDRSVVASTIFNHVAAIDYSNFKASIEDPDLHDACMDTWHTFKALERPAPIHPKSVADDGFAEYLQRMSKQAGRAKQAKRGD